MQFHPLDRSDRWKLKLWKSKLKFGVWIDMHRSFNIDEHLTEQQHWQPVFLFSKPSVSIHVCCSYIELSQSKLHKTGDLQVGNFDTLIANILELIRSTTFTVAYALGIVGRQDVHKYRKLRSKYLGLLHHASWIFGMLSSKCRSLQSAPQSNAPPSF